MSNWSAEIIQYGEDYRKLMREMKEMKSISPHKYGMMIMSKKKKKNKGAK